MVINKIEDRAYRAQPSRGMNSSKNLPGKRVSWITRKVSDPPLTQRQGCNLRAKPRASSGGRQDMGISRKTQRDLLLHAQQKMIIFRNSWLQPSKPSKRWSHGWTPIILRASRKSHSVSIRLTGSVTLESEMKMRPQYTSRTLMRPFFILHEISQHAIRC